MKRRLGMTTPTPSNDIDLCLALVPCATSVLQAQELIHVNRQGL